MANGISVVQSFLIMISLVHHHVMASSPPNNQLDLNSAIDEMERANYFTFVMLLNMVPPDLFQGNVTFLMPSDKSLSRSMILQSSVTDLLLRHSIPSSLLFDHLLHLPTNSMLPTSNPDLMLTVSNNGRKAFLLGNARIVSPNICTHGYSVRCHGIDGVVNIQKPGPPITCPQISIPVAAAAPGLAPPSLGPASAPPNSESSKGTGRHEQMKLSLTYLAFVWVVYSKAVSLV